MTTLLKVDLPANVREGVEKALTTALQQLHTITKAVSEGTAITTEGAVIPEEFNKALGMVLEQLAPIAKEAPSQLGTEASDKLKAIAAAIATIAEADSPDSVTDMIGRLIKVSGVESKEALTLKALGELSIALSNDPVANGKHAESTVEKVQALTKTLGELVSVDASAPAEPVTPPVVEPTPAAKTGMPVVPPVVEPAATTKTDVPTPPAEPVAPPAAAPVAKTNEPAVSPAAQSEDKIEKAMTEIMVEFVKSGAKMSKERKALLRTALKAISDLAEQVDPADPVDKVDVPAAAPTPPVEPAPVTKVETVDVIKMVQDLNTKVSALMDKPAAPASRRVEGNPETGTASPVTESPRRKRRWIV